MATFRVELIQSIVETCVVWIEANNPDEAERLALKQAVTGSDADFKFKDVLDGVEVLSVQQQIITIEQEH